MTKKMFFIAIIINIASLTGLWILSDIPFGSLFNSVFYLFAISLVTWLAILAYISVVSSKKWKNIVGYVISIVSLAVSVGLILFIIDFRIFLNCQFNKELTDREWVEDMEYFTEQMELLHPDLFSMVSEHEFQQSINDLKAKIPLYDDNKIRAEFLKILALPNDAHTIPNIQSLDLDWHLYPLNIFYFNDGIYITDAGRGNKEMIGSKLLKIGRHDVQEVYNKLKKYLGAENEYHSKSRLAIILMSEWLQAEGFINDTKNVSFELQNQDGELYESYLDPIHYLPYFYWTLIRKVDNDTHPAITNDRKGNYWFEFRNDSKSFYLQFNACEEDADNPLNDFIAQLDNAVTTTPFDKFIIDIRYNNGGAVNMLHPLTDFIINNKAINQHGKLYVLTSRKTFSAAVLFASILERNTRAIFVGEPTAQAPFQRGGGFPRIVTLPNSGLQYYVSTTFIHAGFAMDDRFWIAPDIQLPFAIDDFMNNRDVVMETVLKYRFSSLNIPYPEESEMERLSGRFLFSQGQILIISGNESKAQFEISDYLENSLQHTRSELYKKEPFVYSTDINDVTIRSFPENEGLIDSIQFCWGDSCRVVYRVDDGFKLPMELFKKGDIEHAIAEAEKNKDYFRNLPQNMEFYFNNLGYKYLGKGETELAIKIFKFNTELYPTSANTFDSLGEAYLKAGQKSLAVENYKKSLKLNPNNANAKKNLETL